MKTQESDWGFISSAFLMKSESEREMAVMRGKRKAKWKRNIDEKGSKQQSGGGEERLEANKDKTDRK